MGILVAASQVRRLELAQLHADWDEHDQAKLTQQHATNNNQPAIPLTRARENPGRGSLAHPQLLQLAMAVATRGRSAKLPASAIRMAPAMARAFAPAIGMPSPYANAQASSYSDTMAIIVKELIASRFEKSKEPASQGHSSAPPVASPPANGMRVTADRQNFLRYIVRQPA